MSDDALTHVNLVSCTLGDAHIAFLSHHVRQARPLRAEQADNTLDLASCLNLEPAGQVARYQLQLMRSETQTQNVSIACEMLLLELSFAQVFSLPQVLKQRNSLPGLIALAYDAEQQRMLSIIDPTLWQE